MMNLSIRKYDTIFLEGPKNRFTDDRIDHSLVDENKKTFQKLEPTTFK